LDLERKNSLPLKDQRLLRMSVIGGRAAENICSFQVFRGLTLSNLPLEVLNLHGQHFAAAGDLATDAPAISPETGLPCRLS
jgi:hypothetical protein